MKRTGSNHTYIKHVNMNSMQCVSSSSKVLILQICHKTRKSKQDNKAAPVRIQSAVVACEPHTLLSTPPLPVSPTLSK